MTYQILMKEITSRYSEQICFERCVLFTNRCEIASIGREESYCVTINVTNIIHAIIKMLITHQIVYSDGQNHVKISRQEKITQINYFLNRDKNATNDVFCLRFVLK